MSRWQRRVDDLLYDGETIRESVDVETARVVVTSHRVLAFKPEMEGENFQQVDRPNVTGVGTGARSKRRLLRWGLLTGVWGGLLFVAGVWFDPGSILGEPVEFDASATDEFGLGGVMRMTQAMLALLWNLDTLLLVSGALVLSLAAVLLGVYWYLRTPTLVVAVAGEQNDVHIPRPAGATETATRLEQAILPEPPESQLTDADTDTARQDTPDWSPDKDNEDVDDPATSETG